MNAVWNIKSAEWYDADVFSMTAPQLSVDTVNTSASTTNISSNSKMSIVNYLTRHIVFPFYIKALIEFITKR